MSEAGFNEFSREALNLPANERSRLANLLLESLDTDDGFTWHASWEEKIRRRVEEVEQGRATLMEHDAVMSRARALLAERRG